MIENTKKLNSNKADYDKVYYIDKELSKKLYDMCKHFVKPNECFTNIGYIYDVIKSDPKFDDVEIVYGAWEVEGINGSTQLFCRHCFLLLNDSIIDPTFFTTTKKDNPKYIVIKRFSKFEYGEALTKSDLDTSLSSYVNNDYEVATKYLLSKDILVIG